MQSEVQNEAFLTIKQFAELSNYNPPANIEDCYFYHTIDLPKHGTKHGHWDIRGNESGYLGGLDFRGTTFFDCGVASGFL